MSTREDPAEGGGFPIISNISSKFPMLVAMGHKYTFTMIDTCQCMFKQDMLLDPEQTITARNSRNIFSDKLISTFYRPQKGPNVNAPVPDMTFFAGQQHNAPPSINSELRTIRGF